MTRNLQRCCGATGQQRRCNNCTQCCTHRTLDFDFAVNYSAVNQPQGKLLCLVGDDPDALVVDVDTGRTTHELHGHYDYSFAAAWHPDGHVVATGNQDKTLRVWDLRYPSASLAVLEGSMAAIRSLQFSSDGRFLAAAEPADFVHVFDVGASLRKAQVRWCYGVLCALSQHRRHRRWTYLVRFLA